MSSEDDLGPLAHKQAALCRVASLVAAGVAPERVFVAVTDEVGRLPAGVKATAHFLVGEALTNVVKHARARGAQVTARVEGGDREPARSARSTTVTV